MRQKLILIFLILILVFSSVAIAKDKVDRKDKLTTLQSKLTKVTNPGKKVEILKELGRLYHQEAALGNEKAVPKAIKSLKKAKNIKNTPTIRAWYGSALTLKGRYAFALGKIYYSKKGIKILDQAVKASPNNIETRLVRGVNSLYLPDFIFHRLDLAKKDLNYIIKTANKHPQKVRDGQLVTAYLNLGKYYQKKEKFKLAIEAWEEVISFDVNQTQSERAKKYIKELQTTSED
ncbi:tetratricopeptide repeat protein [Selenihalanaerobacter shriftii]|uniref:Uncharacterized protein n=1 Tax=Selenihalanaerobacter shriftii TaxID=142842 RepID=A0A1T4K6J0_9FIRM|nr:tetratricopeptide repeat protein [Selenihalanaerobacter shriftii]SJZ38039.1 hypothetical protein SAMN02745118_00643 [Selenihalanaerobacter shriftii]